VARRALPSGFFVFREEERAKQETSKKLVATRALPSGFLFVLLIRPEDGGSEFLQHVSELYRITQHYIVEVVTVVRN
jgi:hypothetical protein